MSVEEDAEEWDWNNDDLWEHVKQLEERAVSSSTTQPKYLVNDPSSSYSPPRELSQRPPPPPPPPDFSDSFDLFSAAIRPSNSAPSPDNAKDLEIKRLKWELEHVSKQRLELEHECFELKKEKKEKEELIKLASAKNDNNVANIHHSQGIVTNSIDVNDIGCCNRKCGVPITDHHEVSEQSQNTKISDDHAGARINTATSSNKAIGVQVDLPSHFDLSKKLQAIWGSPSDQELGKSLISKLFVHCSQEFHVLFGCMEINASSKMIDSLAIENSDGALPKHTHSDASSVATKVSHLYSVLTKIGNGMTQLEYLLEPLLDLCHLDNVVVVNKSLRVLHVFLKHLMTLGSKAKERENIMVEGVLSRKKNGNLHGSDSAKSGLFHISGDEASCAGYVPFGVGSSEAETVSKKGLRSPDKATLHSPIDWVSLFELMNQTAVRITDSYVRSEAISIMNMIVMSSYSYTEREKFGQKLVFESIPQLLKKEAGLCVQREAVRLLYLLLNCPKLFATFCSGCKDWENASAANDNHELPSCFGGLRMILDGLADCLNCCGNNLQDLDLRRNTIVVLAFLASSGKSGIEILVSRKLCREVNFLMLILQVLVSEIDAEAAAFTVPADMFRARTLLIREILILLNRLVSNPAYSSIFLRVLTDSRDMASLTIDVATRLSKKVGRLGQSDIISRQMRESEVVDLGRIFKRRVYAYLGDSIL